MIQVAPSAHVFCYVLSDTFAEKSKLICRFRRLCRLNLLIFHVANAGGASQGNHRALASTALCELGSPFSQPCRSASVHHHRCGLAQCLPQVGIPCLGGAARYIAFAGLVARRCEARPRSNSFRRGKAHRIIDGGAEGECHNSPNPWHRHQAVANRIILSELANLFSRVASS